MNKFLNNVVLSLLKTMKVGWYDGELKQLVFGNEGKWYTSSKEPGFQPTILIVAREHYQESLTHYPITKSHELRKVINLSSSPQDVYCVNSQKSDGAWVNKWFFNSGLPKALLRLPLSLLLSKSEVVLKNPQLFSIGAGNDSGQLFIASTNRGVHSLKQTKTVSSVQRFAEVVGVNCTTNVINLPSTLMFEQALIGITNIVLSSPEVLLRFVSKKEIKGLSSKLLKVSGIAAVGVALYLVATSTYLIGIERYYQSQIDTQKIEVAEALQVQSTLLGLQDAINELESHTNAFRPTANVWEVFLGVKDSAAISRVSYTNERFVFYGQAPKATGVLALIAGQPSVIDARFDTPVRSTRKGERFVISFALAPQIGEALNTEATAR